MLSTKSLEILVRQHPLTDDDWIQLIEGRRELIKPHLDAFTLPTLGALKCLKIEHWLNDLGHWKATDGDERFSIQTQGLFFLQPHSAMVYNLNREHRCMPGDALPGTGIKKAWGLTRSGQWVIVTIGFVRSSGYKGRGREDVTDVCVDESDVPAILAETKTPAKEVWQALGQAVKNLAEQRKRLYVQARTLANMVDVDELLLRFVPEPQSST